MKSLFSFLLIFVLVSCAHSQENPMVIIHTDMGDIKIKLYNETPQHRDNFLKLASEGYFDGTLFHRVINQFMIQGGDPDSKNAVAGQQLGEGGPDYTLPAEFVYPKLFHKKGVLAAAREGDQVNPEKRSSASQFYLVQGKVFTDEDIAKVQERMTNIRRQNAAMNVIRVYTDSLNHFKALNDSLGWAAVKNRAELKARAASEAIQLFSIPEELKTVYKTIGGTPHLDGNYTVFGEVVEGLDVIDKIAAVQTDSNDRPVQDIKMRVEVVKRK
jgi:cyclophilin family peptidyl-prolyl cis-trans isomerase